MSHLGDALREFPCGPGCHDFDTVGMMTAGGAVALASGEAMPDSFKDLLLCTNCMKHGSDGICGFCDNPCSHYGAVSGPGVKETIAVALCPACHICLVNKEDVGDWTFIAMVPNPPSDP
jgi:hypothetical protein